MVTWGIASAGGDSTAVQHRLSRVQRVVASNRAFATILEDGRVATWGDPDAGGDCTEVQDQLRDVQQLVSTDSAFAALVDGRVVAWGEPEAGGDCTEVLDELSDVRHIAGTSSAFGTTGAFAATREDGTVVTWGDPDAGGDSSAVRDQLQSVQQVKATARAFAALRADGRVAGWGFSAVFFSPIPLLDEDGTWKIQLKKCQTFSVDANSFPFCFSNGIPDHPGEIFCDFDISLGRDMGQSFLWW